MAKAVFKILKWRGRQVRAEAKAKADDRAEMAASFLQREIQRSMKIGGKGGGGFVRHSKPGEPPYVQTGRGRASIFKKKVRGFWHVGTNLNYMVFHELTKRPFIRPAFNMNRRKIDRILQKGRL